MKINDIKALAELVSKNDLSALEYSEGETHLRIENAPRTVTAAPAQAAPARSARRPGGRARGGGRARRRGGCRRGPSTRQRW